MTRSLKASPQVFDPHDEYTVVHRRLPHWSQAGTLAFITWRTFDSIPKHVLDKWLAERDEWLARHRIGPAAIQSLPPHQLREFHLHFSDRWNDYLDNCHGDCVLRRADLAEVVTESLRHFDGDRYELADFVVMPNHVHVIAAFPDESSLLQSCDSWKHFTSTQINRALARKGRFWQSDGFDHLIRSLEQFEYLRLYVRDNPRRAYLKPGEYIHWSK